MAKEKEPKEELAEVRAEAKSDRELAWEKFLVKYEKQNPAKYASRKAAGELDRIPDSFNG